MTLVEVVVAITVLSITALGLLSMAMASARFTSAAIYRASVTAIMQGYIEQAKNMPFDLLPISPPAGTDTADELYPGQYAIPTQRDSTTIDALVLSPLPRLLPTSITPGTVPAGVYDNVKTFDVNRAGDLVLHIWTWVEDATPSGGPAQQVKSITIVYMWQTRDGANVRSYVDTVKMVRSLVPTY